MDPRNLTCAPYYQRWIKNHKRSEIPILSSLFERYIQSVVDFLSGKVNETMTSPPLETIVPITPFNQIRQLCHLLESLLPQDSEIKDPEAIESLFVFALIWSFGDTLVDDSLVKLDQFIKRLTNWITIDAPGKFAQAGQIPGTPSTLYEFEFNVQDAIWVPWNQYIKNYEIPIDAQFNSIIVPTTDTCRNLWLLNTFINISHQPVLLVGKSGTAKTTTVSSFLYSLDQNLISTKVLNFSNNLQVLLLLLLEEP
jgi:dynein heavy chain